jgi:membrane-associated phospholipid phosphatase
MDDLLKKTFIAAGLTGVVYLLLFFFADRVIDLWIHNNYSDTWLHQSGSQISYFAKGDFFSLALTVCLLFTIIYDPGLKKKWTRQLLFICVSTSIAIIVGDGLKYLLARYRPIMLFQDNLYGLHFLSSKWALNSTPSGHTIRAFSLLTAISLLSRRFTVIFMTVAVLIGASRVLVTDHYPSDVLLGAFVGIFTAIWTYRYFFGHGPESQGILPRLLRP